MNRALGNKTLFRDSHIVDGKQKTDLANTAGMYVYRMRGGGASRLVILKAVSVVTVMLAVDGG
jgi:hypothetical protein